MSVFVLSGGSFISIGGHRLRPSLSWIEELFISRLVEKPRPSLEKAVRGSVQLRTLADSGLRANSSRDSHLLPSLWHFNEGGRRCLGCVEVGRCYSTKVALYWAGRSFPQGLGKAEKHEPNQAPSPDRALP